MSRVEEGSEFLEHYGVKGMKWGVRRSQAALQKAAAKRREARDPSTPEGAERAKRKAAVAQRRLLDDADLDRYVQRLEKEKKLKNLVEDDLSAGQKATKAFLSDTGQRIAKQAVIGTAGVLIGAALANKFGDTTPSYDKTGNLLDPGKVIPTAKEIYKVAKPQLRNK